MKIVLHCSAGNGCGNAALFTKIHVKDNGWSNIGYHYVILNGRLSEKCFNPGYDGQIETGRPLDSDNMLEPEEWGAHVKGMNRESIGICMVGKSGQFTQAQKDSLIGLLSELRLQFGEIEITQHSDHDLIKSYCAGLSSEEMARIITAVS